MSTCAACHKPIFGRYLRALGGEWHPECFLCPECRQPIGQGSFMEKKGYPFHPECYARKHAPRCAGCQEPIVSTSVTALGRNYHPQCLLCAKCRQPLREANFLTHDQQPYHVACYHARFSPRCIVCQGPIQSVNYVTNGWGETFCHEHLNQYASCAACNRLMAPTVTGGGVIYADGRPMCNVCRKTAVDHEFVGSKLLRQVRQFLTTQGMPFPETPIPLRLTNAEEMRRLSPTSPRNRPPVGLTRTRIFSRGGQEVERLLEEILILHGLPEEQFTMVAAHELCHAWLFINHFNGLTEEVEEGLATLCEHLWLQAQNTPQAAFRLKGLEEDRDPVYGAGYRAGRQALQRLSFPDLLDFIKKQGRWPLHHPLARLLRVI